MPPTTDFCALCLRALNSDAALIEVVYLDNKGETQTKKIVPNFRGTLDQVVAAMVGGFLELRINYCTVFLYAQTRVMGTSVCRAHVENEFIRTQDLRSRYGQLKGR